MENEITDNVSRSRFEMKIGDDVAFANYRIEGERYLLTYVLVPPHLTGQGHGSTLARAVLEILKNRGKRAIPVCPFMVHYLARHPELTDIVDG